LPGIFAISCTQCRFAEETSESSTWVSLRDGTQELCPHPAERRTAEERTGESWNALVQAGRVHYRYAFLCRECGKVEHHELPRSVSGGHIASIVHRPLATDMQNVPCSRCQAKRLVPVAGPPLGLLVSIPLTVAVVSAFSAIGACGKGLIDLAIDRNGTALAVAAALVGLSGAAARLFWLANRRRVVRAAIPCPICRTGTLQIPMVARS
jgi:hypothetical protein